MAATRALELGFEVLACASTGNLANSVARARRAARPRVLRVHPRQPRSGQAARLGRCSARRSSPIARQLRRREPAVHAGRATGTAGASSTSTCVSYYAEGAKTFGFEIAEQLGWRFPKHRRLAGGRRHAPAAHPARVPRTAARSASSMASCRGFTRRRRLVARRSCARSKRGSIILNRSSRTRSRSRLRSAIRRTAIRCCRRQSDRRPGTARAATTRSSKAIQLLARDRRHLHRAGRRRRRRAAIEPLVERGAIPRDESIVVCVHRERLQDDGGGCRTPGGTTVHLFAPSFQRLRVVAGVAPGDCIRLVVDEAGSAGESLSLKGL